MKQFQDIYRNKKVLITGHTGFKGSWLSLWLSELGAEITGVSLAPETEPNHWNLLRLSFDDQRIDIRDYDKLYEIFKKKKPEIVFHLAAQPLVRRSYKNPLETWSINIMGTAHVLEACRNTPSVQAIVVITTDKCYENQEWIYGYRENDRLGGHDPYSASKASTELISSSYRTSFFNGADTPLLATVRAGNVIGGGDWSEDRLIPDLMRSIQTKAFLTIRSPQATRPWQHVLEALYGYLLLGQKLLNREGDFAGAWNFGPSLDGNISVHEVLIKLKENWNKINWHVSSEKQPHEAQWLHLDSSKAVNQLKWKPIWDIDITLMNTLDWYRSFFEDNKVISLEQLSSYIQTQNRHT